MSVANTFQNRLDDDGIPVRDVTLADDGELTVTTMVHDESGDPCEDLIPRTVVFFWKLHDVAGVGPLTLNLVDEVEECVTLCECTTEWAAAAVASSENLGELTPTKRDVLASIRAEADVVGFDEVDVPNDAVDKGAHRMSASAATEFRRVLEGEGVPVESAEVEESGRLVVVLDADDVVAACEETGADGATLAVAAYWSFHPGTELGPLEVRLHDETGVAASFICRREWAEEVAEVEERTDDRGAIWRARSECLQRVYDTEIQGNWTDVVSARGE
ncbi:hypothetical protein [Halopelagius fulvigenes]|uniref:Uncharacterized protein n=1 Tax=Halopelagius fulvigenes TaxID=1198324 RepID=A0ABD5TS65_9EURY